MHMEKAPVKHNRLRRMERHDYTSACIYLVTLTTVERKRVLGSLVGDSADHAEIEPTALGKYVFCYISGTSPSALSSSFDREADTGRGGGISQGSTTGYCADITFYLASRKSRV